MVNLKINNKEEGNVSRDTGLIKTLGPLKSKGGKGGKGDFCSFFALQSRYNPYKLGPNNLILLGCEKTKWNNFYPVSRKNKRCLQQ